MSDNIKCKTCGGIDITEPVWCHSNKREIEDADNIWYKWDTRNPNKHMETLNPDNRPKPMMNFYWCNDCKDGVEIKY